MLKLNVPDMILYEKCQYVVLVMRSFPSVVILGSTI